LYCKLRN